MTEKKEEEPAAMNAFELIAMSKGLDLGNLFDADQVCLPIILSIVNSNFFSWKFEISN